jgi:hypothetical protein
VPASRCVEEDGGAALVAAAAASATTSTASAGAAATAASTTRAKAAAAAVADWSFLDAWEREGVDAKKTSGRKAKKNRKPEAVSARVPNSGVKAGAVAKTANDAESAAADVATSFFPEMLCGLVPTIGVGDDEQGDDDDEDEEDESAGWFRCLLFSFA